jgi:hypothetical protein
MARKFLTPIDLNKNELQNATIQNLASDPASPAQGQVYYSTAGLTLKFWNGASWLAVTTGTPATANGASTIVLRDANGNFAANTITATLTGTAANATVLQTPRAINGTNFDGSAAITVTANAGTLTHTVLNATVVSSSLTSVGILNGLTIAATQTVSMGGNKITNVGTPTADSDAATKLYVDSTAQGIDWKASVRAATTANGTLASAYANGSVVDGVTLATGNRILIKDQTTGSENGIYTVNATGAPTRAVDADTATEISAAFAVFVEEGTDNADSGFVLTNNGTVTVGTTALTFTQFTGLGQVTAGTGLTKTGNTLNVGGTTDRITVGSDTVDIASTYAGQTTIVTLGNVTTGTWSANVIPGLYGGTGVANSGKTITLGGNLTTAGAYATTLTVSGTTNATLPAGTVTLVDLASSQALTTKTYNGLSLTAAATGFTVAGGTTSKTLTVSNTVTLTATDGSTLAIGGGGTLGTGAYATIADYAPLVSPSFTTPSLGVATATSINRVAITQPASGATLTIANLKTLTVSNTLTLAGTDSTTMTFPSTSATIARIDAAQTFTGVQSMTSPNVTTSITTSSTSFDFIVGTATTLNIGTDILGTINVGTGAMTSTQTRTIAIGAAGMSNTASQTINIGTNSGGSGTTIGIGATGVIDSITTISGTVKLPTVGTSGFVKLSTGGQLVQDTGTYTKKYAVSNGALTAASGVITWTVTHSLGTKDVHVAVYQTSTDALVDVDVVATSTSVVTLTFNSASLTGSEYRVVVIG